VVRSVIWFINLFAVRSIVGGKLL